MMHGALPLMSAPALKKDGNLIVSLSIRHKEQPPEITLSLLV